MNPSSQPQTNTGQAPSQSGLPTLAELRKLEDQLDWLENHRSTSRRRLALLISPLLPAVALAAALWPRKPHG